MKKKLSKGLLAVAMLGIGACSSDNEPGAPVDSFLPDTHGQVYLYKDMKVAANTDFTMEQFEQELFSHESWEEVTISSYENGKWNNNLNAIEGYDGWTYQQCYEFGQDGTVKIYEWPNYKGGMRDTVRYTTESFSINPEKKSFTFRRVGEIMGEPFDISYEHRIVAVDKGRIIFDEGNPETSVVTRTSIEPYEIKAVKKE